MSLIYDYRWPQNLSDDQNMLRTAEWMSLADNYDSETISRALEYCANRKQANKSGEHWPPNIPEFNEICRANKTAVVKVYDKKSELDKEIENQENHLRSTCEVITKFKHLLKEGNLTDLCLSKSQIERKLDELYKQKRDEKKVEVQCGKVTYI
jgi:hypothetical protein